MQRCPSAEIREISSVIPVLKCVEGETCGQRSTAGKSLTIFIFYLHETMMDHLCLIGIYDPKSDI